MGTLTDKDIDKKVKEEETTSEAPVLADEDKELPAFFRWEGFIKSGPSALEAIEQARRERGRS